MEASRQLVDAICLMLEDPTESWTSGTYYSHRNGWTYNDVHKTCITHQDSNLVLTMRGHIRSPVDMKVGWWRRFRVRRSIAVAQEHVVRRSIKTMLPADVLRQEMGLSS